MRRAERETSEKGNYFDITVSTSIATSIVYLTNYLYSKNNDLWIMGIIVWPYSSFTEMDKFGYETQDNYEPCWIITHHNKGMASIKLESRHKSNQSRWLPYSLRCQSQSNSALSHRCTMDKLLTGDITNVSEIFRWRDRSILNITLRTQVRKCSTSITFLCNFMIKHERVNKP